MGKSWFESFSGDNYTYSEFNKFLKQKYDKIINFSCSVDYDTAKQLKGIDDIPCLKDHNFNDKQEWYENYKIKENYRLKIISDCLKNIKEFSNIDIIAFSEGNPFAYQMLIHMII